MRLRDGLHELESAGLHVPTGLLCQLEEFAVLVSQWSARINLTAYEEPAQIEQHLVLDAVALSSVLPRWETLVDIGAGAGFPGVPLACLYPDRQVTLVESRLRRHHFQREVRRHLNLRNLVLCHGRAESLPANPANLVLSRAVAPPMQAVDLLSPWVHPDGWMGVAVSSGFCQDEEEIGTWAGGVRSYRVPGLNYPRHIWLARHLVASEE